MESSTLFWNAEDGEPPPPLAQLGCRVGQAGTACPNCSASLEYIIWQKSSRLIRRRARGRGNRTGR